MPMMTVADLPADTYVRIKPDGNNVQFRIAERDGSFKILGNGDMLGGLDLVGVLDILWMAYNIEAVHGWGPFLMDIALEWATEKGGGVFPHNCGIVPPAKVMWKIYYEQRTDVRHLEMPDELITTCNVRHAEPELRCIYEKTPFLLPALDAAGLLIRG
jgi:hypothetical protein